MKSRKLKIGILIALIIVVLFVVFVATRPKTKADFSHYKTAQELQTYLETRLPVVTVTVKQVEEGLLAEGIIGCRVA